jgi:hypothetical protein
MGTNKNTMKINYEKLENAANDLAFAAADLSVAVHNLEDDDVIKLAAEAAYKAAAALEAVIKLANPGKTISHVFATDQVIGILEGPDKAMSQITLK